MSTSSNRPVADKSDSLSKLENSSKLIPCVRYGYPKDSDHPRQEPTLHTIFDLIPDNATTVSPVYLLTPEAYDRQTQFENPYAVKEAKCIATSLQNSCEEENRVYYPIHAESDAYDNGVSFEQMIEWLTQFVEEKLRIPRNKCRFYYSGNRSIHIHVPKFITSEKSREQLRATAEQFCEETGAELDTGIYDSKSQFRIPGVRHRNESGFRKIEIEPHWNHNQIIKAATEEIYPVWTYSDVLARVFEKFSGQPTIDCTIGRAIFANDRCILCLDSHDSDKEIPLIEQESPPDIQAELKQWEPYNRKEFSPYAKASGNDRSMAVVRILGGAFARNDTRDGATLIPAFFYGAIGCVGKEFTKFQDRAPLQLSTLDYQKWNYETGDNMVIIGGQSRNSRIFPVDRGTAELVGDRLHPENGSKEKALTYLENEGYKIGSSGSTMTANQRNPGESQELNRVLPANSPISEASESQRRAEQNDIRSLSHEELYRVANRLLQKFGWSPTYEWVAEQFGSEFKPHETWLQLKSIVNRHDDLSHIDVPPAPS